VLGGDCTILLGIALALRRRGRYGLLFLDGHADFYQPEAEPTGEAASMELALVTGRGPDLITDLEGRRPLLRDEDVVVFGYRDADHAAAEGSRPLAPTIHAIDLASVRERGAGRAARDALAHLERTGGPAGFWVHLDVDVLDDAIMPAVDYHLPDGLTWEELTAVLRTEIASEQATGLDITIFNPALDPDGRVARSLVDALVTGLTPVSLQGTVGGGHRIGHSSVPLEAAMKGGFGLLGVPSSAAAHGPGQEKAPAALRRAGLPARLAAAGVRVADYGDLPVVRWRPDPHQRRPHNLQAVLDVLRKTSRRVGGSSPPDGSRWCWAANAASPPRCWPPSGTGASSRRCSPWTAAWTCSPRPPTPPGDP
jgi:arginase family enzyme